MNHLQGRSLELDEPDRSLWRGHVLEKAEILTCEFDLH